MKNIKTIYLIIAIVSFTIIGILVVIPQIIPSLLLVQKIILGIIYIVNFAFGYILVIRIWRQLKNMFDRTRAFILSGIVSAIIISALLFFFVITSISQGQGFMGGTFYKEIYYPKQKVSLYLYDDGFLDPLTSIKIKSKTWPVMNDLVFIENCGPGELIVVNKNDTVRISNQNILVKINLLTRTAKKEYLQKNEIKVVQ